MADWAICWTASKWSGDEISRRSKFNRNKLPPRGIERNAAAASRDSPVSATAASPDSPGGGCLVCGGKRTEMPLFPGKTFFLLMKRTEIPLSC
ncbi:hypothetical protein R50912_23195 [Paenibacillus sp. FSL R5-0912]|nr:hypothetical protein R50912_23195 [Paenibacillus sp. FSL R5-0912]